MEHQQFSDLQTQRTSTLFSESASPCCEQWDVETESWDLLDGPPPGGNFEDRRPTAQHQNTCAMTQQKSSGLASSTDRSLPDAFDPSSYCPDFSQIFDDSFLFWDPPDSCDDSNRDGLQTPAPEWVDVMCPPQHLSDGPSASNQCRGGDRLDVFDAPSPPSFHQFQPPSSPCLNDMSASWTLDFSVRVGSSPQGVATATRKMQMHTDVTTRSQTIMAPPATPTAVSRNLNIQFTSSLAQGTSLPEYQARQNTSFRRLHSVSSTASPAVQCSATQASHVQCPARDTRPSYVRVGKYAIPYVPTSHYSVTEDNQSGHSSGPQLASFPVRQFPLSLPNAVPCRLYVPNDLQSADGALDLSKNRLGGVRSANARELLSARRAMQQCHVGHRVIPIRQPRRVAVPVVDISQVDPDDRASSHVLPEANLQRLVSGGISDVELKEKRSPVESRCYAAEYKMMTLKIGPFTVCCLDDETSSRLSCKFKIIFSKRRFIYEFDTYTAVNEAEMRTSCIIVPFQSLSAFRCEDTWLTIQVQARPLIFYGRRTEKSPADVADASRLIRAAHLEYFPIHKIQLHPLDASQARQKLWQYSPKFHELMLRHICVPETRLRHPLPPHPSRGRWCQPRPRARPSRINQSRQPASVAARPLLARTAGSVASSACSCHVNCRSSDTCSCARARAPCDSQRCSCAGCDNPLNHLLTVGVSLQEARADLCLMEGIYRVRDLSWYLYQAVRLHCSPESATVRECIPGLKPCPRCGVPAQFSWCTNALFHDATVYHCPNCARCNYGVGRHCLKCNACFHLDIGNQHCPRCRLNQVQSQEAPDSTTPVLG
ncbi:uncharacterized protein LOC135397154 [Ornithodoros turicata]|uniref:uncharacterized protein LOC135397154 n=1 Tax=Ornithodoros turicata TaxID=34597 RepID=UPI003139F4B7